MIPYINSSLITEILPNFWIGLFASFYCLCQQMFHVHCIFKILVKNIFEIDAQIY